MVNTITHPTACSSPSSALRCVFVYGTLRRGEQRDINLLLPTPIFIGHGQLPGTLYHLGDYPGVRLGGSQSVQGEVYQITPELERQLDVIEEVWPQQTGEYTRQEVSVVVGCTLSAFESASGSYQLCLVYEIAERCTQCRPVIASGNWLKR